MDVPKTKIRTISCLVASLALAGTLATGVPPAQAAPIPTPDHPVTHDDNPRVPEGASWTEEYFPSSDGSDVELHADVLRPAHLPDDAKTPVILSAGPYFSHAGEMSDEDLPGTGPSDRFNDLIKGADLMSRGYTVVMVDLRGYGGSTGCLDMLGPGEQADVQAAVEWSANQPWSSGKVGMYGKSYDATSALIGNNLAPEGLEAVVAQEPLWDMYNHSFSNGVPRYNVLETPKAYNTFATIPAMSDDSERYQKNAAYEKDHPECLENNLTDNQNPDQSSDYWQDRDLAAQAKGSDVPLFMTQGFIESSTQAEDVELYLDHHEGVERGWLGPWEHVRGNEVGDDGKLRMGREGWFDEVMRFYDEHLRGVEPTVEDPPFLVEDSRGEWRAQDSWPAADRTVHARLEPGSYLDDGADAASTDNHYKTWSRPVARDTRITGAPQVSLAAEGEGNVMVQLWDVAPDGTAVMFDERMSLVRDGLTRFNLRSTDWTLATGHQLVVSLGTNLSPLWADTPSQKTIMVNRASVRLDLQNPAGDQPAAGERSPYLDDYLSYYTEQWKENDRGRFPLIVRS